MANAGERSSKLTVADLARVDRGTPAGEWFRRYWMVVGRTQDLRDIPLAITILGEDLVLFRNQAGFGLLGLNCPHRGTSLEYGDIEPNGLRCPYHGWLFDLNGACLEQPAEPQGSTFCEKVKHLSYPVREMGGLIFGYLGPATENLPPVPRYAPLVEPGGQRRMEEPRHYEYNWYNFIENGADPAHFSILHRADPNDGTWRSWFFNAQDVPAFDAVATNYGMKVVSRKAGDDPDTDFVDEKSYALPSVMQIGDTEYTHFKAPKEALSQGSHNAHWMFLTPNDNDHFTLYTVDHYTGPDPEFINKLAPSRRPVSRENKQDHDNRKLSPFRGSVRLEDIMTQSTQGSVVKRKEQLAASDKGIILQRKIVLEAMECVRRGLRPKGVLSREEADELVRMDSYTGTREHKP